MAGEYPVIPCSDLLDICGQDGLFAANMTVCVESFVGDGDSGGGVKLEEQVPPTPQGVESLINGPYESRLL